MQAIILAAGLGTRLRPITDKIPKPLISVAGVPILTRTLRELPEAIDEIIIVVGYHADKIKEFLGETWEGRSVKYVVQNELLGTGQAVHATKDLIRGKFLALNGDDLYRKSDLERLIKHDLGMLMANLEQPIRSGALICDECGCLREVRENTETTQVNIGCYVLNKNFFDYPLVKLEGRNEFGLPQTLITMTKDMPVAVIEAEFWMPVGTHEELARANQYFAEKIVVC